MSFGSSPQMAFDAVSLTLLTLSLLSGFKTKHKPLCLPCNSPGNLFGHMGVKGAQILLHYSFAGMLVCVTSQT